MKFIMPLAGDRCSGATRSGIRDITGPLPTAWAIFMRRIIKTRRIREGVFMPKKMGIQGIRENKMAPIGSEVII